MSKEKIKNILLNYLHILVGCGLLFFAISIWNKYFPSTFISIFLDSFKVFMIPILGAIIIKVQLDMNFLNLELNQKKFIFEQKDKTSNLKLSLIEDINSILPYNSYYERMFDEVPTSLNDKTVPKVSTFILEFREKFNKNQDIMTYYYEIIEDKASLDLLSSINKKIHILEGISKDLKLNSDTHLNLIKSQIEFHNVHAFKYKEQIINLYNKEIQETTNWESFKTLLLEIKSQIEKLN